MSRRGAATVELAIGSVVWVSVTLLGLWLAEVSFLSTKVHEAAAAATWDATGRPLDDFTVADNASAPARYNTLLSQVSTDLSRRYANFDGLKSGDGTQTHRLFAHGDELKVECKRGAASDVDFNVPAATAWNGGGGSVPGQLNAQLRRLYQPRPATMCNASAVAWAWQLPSHFLDDNHGLFKSALRGDGAIHLCGVGRAHNGACGEGLSVLLGDWALDGDASNHGNRNALLPGEFVSYRPEGNMPYVRLVEDLFVVSGERYGALRSGDVNHLSDSARFAAKIGRVPAPNNELKFHMSYAGSENRYGDMLEPTSLIPVECRKCHFNTTGTQPVNGNPELPGPRQDYRELRRPCFLGLSGCSVPR